jgi:hypothetical protein
MTQINSCLINLIIEDLKENFAKLVSHLFLFVSNKKLIEKRKKCVCVRYRIIFNSLFYYIDTRN